MERNAQRVSAYFPKGLVDAIDKEAEKYGVNRNACMKMILTQYFEGQNALTVLGGFNGVLDRLVAMKSYSDMYEPTEEGKKAFKEIQEKNDSLK